MGAGAERRSDTLGRLVCHIDTHWADRHDESHSQHSAVISLYEPDNIQSTISRQPSLITISRRELNRDMSQISPCCTELRERSRVELTCDACSYGVLKLILIIPRSVPSN